MVSKRLVSRSSGKFRDRADQDAVGATDVENEDLEGGKFSGVLGLACMPSTHLTLTS